MLCRLLLRIGLLWVLHFVLLTATSRVDAYPVGSALSLDKLIERADCVCKAVAVSSQPVQDSWFEECAGYKPYATEFKIVEVYKGPPQLKSMVFHHYAYATDKDMPMFYMPQHYEFAVGRTYLVFAAKTPEDRIFRQLWKNHTSQEDQGVFLAADREPRPGQTIQQVCWLELTGLLMSPQANDVKYAIRHLDWLSGGGYERHEDFGRNEVLKALLPLLRHRDREIAQAAIMAFGSNNPYLRGDFAAGWLATVGKGHIPGYATWKEPDDYLGGRRYWKELAAIVDSDAEAATRALAVRALGRARQPEILPLADGWVRDPDSTVVQAAVVLLADFPERVDRHLLATLSADPRAPVRVGVARAIGFGQFVSLIPTLGKLVDDVDPVVAEAAALSLLSFSLNDSKPVLEAFVHHTAYGPLFVNALAQRDPAAYLDELCRTVKTNPQPARWWGGFVIWGDSWEILFRYVQKQSADELNGGKFNALLESLESPASGDPRAPTYYSSSEPRDLYALYAQKGLAGRAQAFRAQCKKAMTYDIDYYFKQVDEHPSNYTRAR